MKTGLFCHAAILNSNVVTESFSRRKLIEIFEIRHGLAFSVTSYLQMIESKPVRYLNTFQYAYGGHFEFQDGGMLNLIEFQMKVN